MTRGVVLWRGVVFWGRGNFLTYENVSVCSDYSVSDIFRIGGTIPPGGVKIYQVGNSETVKMCKVQLFTSTF